MGCASGKNTNALSFFNFFMYFIKNENGFSVLPEEQPIYFNVGLSQFYAF